MADSEGMRVSGRLIISFSSQNVGSIVECVKAYIGLSRIDDAISKLTEG